MIIIVIFYLYRGEETGSMRRCVHCKISYQTAIRFACLYFQTLSHICFSLSRKCNQRNREMKQRGRKHGKYMGPCCVLLGNVCMKRPKSSAICSLQHVLLLDPKP
ncbi:hypothetical protein Ahy_A06g029111 isoform C [Arachis hypogaea]|uniref:Uncharacterized protein n=1 Tax=Arachis hypogaea TaxID=3818 RepID=A0A445CSF9_ARAHY|nr:hypothetical protein Ahy_A06g029111 isoform C [Arachis hypogaea]